MQELDGEFVIDLSIYLSITPKYSYVFRERGDYYQNVNKFEEGTSLKVEHKCSTQTRPFACEKSQRPPMMMLEFSQRK